MRLIIPFLVGLAACTTEPDPGDPNDRDVDSGTDFVSADCGVEEGLCAPDFTLPDTTGALVALSERGGQRVILVGSAMW